MLPKFTFRGPILEPANVRYNPCGDLIFPSVVRIADHVSDALAPYYLYYAPHDAPGGICLAYAQSPEGPWTEYAHNPILTREWGEHYSVSHISSPHILWMESEGQYLLYFHGENDTTRIAATRDGLNFTYEGIAVHTGMYQGISEASYARVFPHNHPEHGRGYLLLFMGNNGGTRRIYAAWSRDGRHFEPRTEPLISPPPGTGVNQVGGPWYQEWEGRHYVLFHGDKANEQLQGVSDIYLAEIEPDLSSARHLGLYFERTEISPDNARASDPCLFFEGATAYLYLAPGPRLKQFIGLATAVPAA